MDIYVPCIVDESPASNLEARGGCKEWHGGAEESGRIVGSCIAVLDCCRVPRLFFYSIAHLFERIFNQILMDSSSSFGIRYHQWFYPHMREFEQHTGSKKLLYHLLV
jgi:hypothetical protein